MNIENLILRQSKLEKANYEYMNFIASLDGIILDLLECECEGDSEAVEHGLSLLRRTNALKHTLIEIFSNDTIDKLES